MVDLLTLGLPFAGPGARVALATGGYIEEAVQLSRAGVKAAAIWGYLTTAMQAANGAGGGGPSSSSGGGSGGASGANGPGTWVPENQAGWKDPARAYQAQITGHTGWAYELNGVEFDGWDGTNLLDAKGPGYSNFLDENGQWEAWFSGKEKLLKEAGSQVAAAGNRPVVWHVAEQDAANAMRQLFKDSNINVNVVHTPANP
jgi:Restriction endonuclease fold toxin 5